MNNAKITAIFLSGVAAAFLVGCGGGSSPVTTTPNSNVPTGTYTVSIIDDNVVDATVSAPECATFTKNGGGSYTLKECTAAPSTITAVGGFVDVDSDGIQGATEVSQTAPLILMTSQTTIANGFVVTPLTTLASQESDLASLAVALGVSQADLFKDNATNRNLMRSVNAILISAREAGITQYNAFVKDLKDQIKASGLTGIAALVAAKESMMNPANLAQYKAKYGPVFGGFIDDTKDIDLTSSPLAQVKNTNTVTAGKVKLAGFVYDKTIANAAITIYDGSTVVGSGVSNEQGRYSIDIDVALLATSKVLKFEAISGTTKLIAYITTDELKGGSFGSKVSSGTIEDLIISNVTTAKAVLVDKINTAAQSNAAVLTQTKMIVETMYAAKVLEIASAIKNVVDDKKDIVAGNNTLELAIAVALGTANTSIYTDHSDDIANDPILGEQLNSTNNVTTGTTTMRSIMEGKTLYQFDYDTYFSSINGTPFTYSTNEIKTDGTGKFIYYNALETASSSYKDDTIPIVFDINTTIVPWFSYKDEILPSGSFKWSGDGYTLYNAGDYKVAEKYTLLSKENILYKSIAATIYFIKSEVIGEGTEGFFTNFVATSHNAGTYDATTKAFTEIGSDSRVSPFYLGSNGYIQTSEVGTDTSYKWEKVTKYNKEFLLIQWSDTRAIYYVSGGKLYKKEYNPIGTVHINWSTDNTLLLGLYKSMTSIQRDKVIQKIIADKLTTQNARTAGIYDAIQPYKQVTVSGHAID
ncbi:MAG: hypothetical protein NTY39_02140 [Campylobacterales bacterium]|nr:hypothetical protein [Campylobacterales bacterium]